jgi:hypothetical protein
MRVRLFAALAVALAAAGCGPTVDLQQGLQATDVSTGWFDMGMVNGQNKLVPTVSFAFKNVSPETLSTLQANVIFRRVGEDTEWGSAYIKVTGSEGLPPGQTSALQTAKSQLGYTGSEPRQEMLANSQFVDARVEIFAKYASTQWQLIGQYPIERRLITK